MFFLCAEKRRLLETPKTAIEEAFKEYTQNRKDIAVLLINQHVCGNNFSYYLNFVIAKL